MQTVNIHAAKTHLSRLVDQAAGGEEIVIARSGRPVARLVPLAQPDLRSRRRLGILAGRLAIPDDFDAPATRRRAGLFRRTLMRLLLDTHLLLWALNAPDRLDARHARSGRGSRQ